jgi:hypothetical protein
MNRQQLNYFDGVRILLLTYSVVVLSISRSLRSRDIKAARTRSPIPDPG